MNHNIPKENSIQQSWSISPLPLFCRLSGLQPEALQKLRTEALTDLGLLKPGRIPILEEITQMVSQSLRVPICVWSVVSEQYECFKAVTGLSHVGQLSPSYQNQELSVTDSFAACVVDSARALLIEDVHAYLALKANPFVQEHGVRAYGGVPLYTSTGQCIGALSIMDVVPRQFSHQDMTFLELMARWSMSEYERRWLQQQIEASHPTKPVQPNGSELQQSIVDVLRLHLTSYLIQELCDPLTAIMGSTAIFNREIYGTLTDKQQEYVGVIRTSGESMRERVNEILDIGVLGDISQKLIPTPVDVEMLGDQLIQGLKQTAEKREQRLKFAVEPGPRIFLLDKLKVRWLMHYLLLSLMEKAGHNSTICIHISSRRRQLILSTWVSNSWLGEGLPDDILRFYQNYETHALERLCLSASGLLLNSQMMNMGASGDADRLQNHLYPREMIGLLLSHYLAELHKGEVCIQGNLEIGHRFVVQLPIL